MSPGLAAKVRSGDVVSVGVFDPRLALRLEHRPFFAFGHPLIDALVELPITDHPVTATVQRREDVERPHVELIYELLTEGMISRGELVRHLVGEDLSVASARLTAAPAVGMPIGDIEIPTWVVMAMSASHEAMSQELEGRRCEVEERDAEVRAAKLEREKRVHDEVLRRLCVRVAELEERIRAIQMRGTERQQRIIRAWQGQVERTRSRLDKQEMSHEAKLREIEQQESTSRYKMLAASLVVPR